MPFPVKAVIHLPMASGVPQDLVMNTLYFDRGTAPTATDFDNLRDVIDHFFHTVPTGGTFSVRTVMTQAFNQAADAASIDFYAVPAVRGPFGAPIAHRTFTMGGGGSTGLPSELALCLSYQRTYGTDVEFGSGGIRPRASDRGRIYIGPMSASDVIADSTTGAIGAVHSVCDAIAMSAAQRFGTEALSDNWVWLQFSNKHWSWDAVTKCWCDNAWDVQRRRGIAANYRKTVTL